MASDPLDTAGGCVNLGVEVNFAGDGMEFEISLRLMLFTHMLAGLVWESPGLRTERPN